MFAYCLNRPTNGSDKTGYRFNGPGERILSNHILADCIMGGGVGGIVIAAAASGMLDWVADAAVTVANLFSSAVQNTYTWFSSAIAGQTIEGKLGDIAGSYGNYKCKEAAKEMEKYLKKKGESFSIITIQFPTYPGYIYSNTFNKIISENGIHIGILYKGRVYCNVHPLGLLETSWVADFEGVGTKIVAVTPVT